MQRVNRHTGEVKAIVGQGASTPIETTTPQGEHKIKRGFLPNACHSAHLAAHPGLDQAIARFVAEEVGAVEADMRMLAELTPFKRDAAD